MKNITDSLRYGSLKTGKVYRRDILEGYLERYRCMMIETGAKRGIVSCDCNDNYVVKEVIENAGGNFLLGKTIVSNKYFGEVIVVEKVDSEVAIN